MVVLPFRFDAGVILTMRVALPLPVIIIFASGTRILLLELAVTASVPAGVSASPMVNDIEPVGTSSWSSLRGYRSDGRSIVNRSNRQLKRGRGRRDPIAYGEGNGCCTTCAADRRDRHSPILSRSCHDNICNRYERKIA